jgi:hypothetical protein
LVTRTEVMSNPFNGVCWVVGRKDGAARPFSTGSPGQISGFSAGAGQR